MVTTEKGFKLLAIRPLTGCDLKYCKNLKRGQVYQFYQDCKFEPEFDDSGKIPVSLVSLPSSIPDDLYNIKRKGKPDLRINISVIVGKNGSGKSTLIELFYLAVYLCSYKEMLKQQKIQGSSNLVVESDFSFNQILNENKRYLGDGIDPVSEFFRGLVDFENKRATFEIYYELEGTIYQLKIDTELKDDPFWFTISHWTGNEKFENDENSAKVFPFYSIALNYSIHGMNEYDLGIWIKSIFHKNDAYQTPLVINPKREDGGYIDVTNERDLQKSRLMANILEIEKVSSTSIDPLFNGKRITKIIFRYYSRSLFLSKIESLDLNIPGSDENETTKFQLESIKEVFELNDFNTYSWVEKAAYLYITRKVVRILDHYKTIFTKDNYLENLKDIKTYEGHITFKLNQAIHFIKNDSYLKTEFRKHVPSDKRDQIGEGYDGFKFEQGFLVLEVENQGGLLNKVLTDLHEGKKVIEFLPPPIFEYDIQFSSNSTDTFENLSSGEKQQIYSIHTLMYHLRNLASVNDPNIKKFKAVNILLDEIELYFHPDLQRTFIQNLLSGIQNIDDYLKGNINCLNILFATHSPFILSDIPSQNVLCLKEGRPSDRLKKGTFGANIHDLLADGFFLSKGFIGELAKKRIQLVIDLLNMERNEPGKLKEQEWDKIKNIISIIGDSILRNKLREMYLELNRDELFIDKEIDSLEIQLRELKNRKNNA